MKKEKEDRYSATDSNLKKALRVLKTQGFSQLLKKVSRYTKLHKNVNYMDWLAKNMPTEDEVAKQRIDEKTFSYRPLISIVIPLYRTKVEFLTDVIESVMNQTYSNFELCLSDGSGWNIGDTKLEGANEINSEYDEFMKVIDKYLEDSRVKYVDSGKQLGIAENTNEAIKIANGEWIVFGDHDDTFAPNALYECVKKINELIISKEDSKEDCINDSIIKKIGLIYTDEDKIREKSGRTEYYFPHFKPDFNLDLLRSINYICHMVMVKKDIVDKIGGIDANYNGAQDYDFLLKVVEEIYKEVDKEDDKKVDKDIKLEEMEKATDKPSWAKVGDRILHVPMPLYHWRVHAESTAAGLDSKNYAHEAGLNALNAHYERMDIDAKAVSSESGDFYVTEYALITTKTDNKENNNDLVSVIIPNKDHLSDLRKCIKSLVKQKGCKYEIVVVENGSQSEEIFEYYKTLEKHGIRVLTWEGFDGRFNYSAINNFAAKYVKGNYLLFLNNDTEMMDEHVISNMLGYAKRDEVGIVGARMYFPNDSIQHAGVFIGYEGKAGHLFVTQKEEDGIYFNRTKMACDYSAVTAACMMMKKEIFERVQGFDEELEVALNDIDLCLRVRELGYLVAYNSSARLYHMESLSRGLDESEEKRLRYESEVKKFQERHKAILANGDPYYNKNLSLEKPDCSLR